jgi:hypothetical protein
MMPREIERKCARDVRNVGHEAPIVLAFRIFAEGVVAHVRDRDALVAQKARTIVDYLDFRHHHERMVAGALKAAALSRSHDDHRDSR